MLKVSALEKTFNPGTINEKQCAIEIYKIGGNNG